MQSKRSVKRAVFLQKNNVTAIIALLLTLVVITCQRSLKEMKPNSVTHLTTSKPIHTSNKNKISTSNNKQTLALQKAQSLKEHEAQELNRSKSLLSCIENNANISSELGKCEPMFTGYRIVHLDLKGAPVSMRYYEEFFPLLKKLGATGVLLEYEDMFPYSGLLEDCISSDHIPHSKSDIQEILSLAKENGLEVIPLIQTFGHLDFVLKHQKYAQLRESPLFNKSICPSHNETFRLVAEMVDQVMSVHPGVRYLHIGCDEVLQLGQCGLCQQRMQDNNWTNADLFLSHVTRTAKYVTERYPNVRPLIWDDHLRTHKESELRSWQLADLVEPVVWAYGRNVSEIITPSVLKQYAAVFPAVWIASAFKGATGVQQYITDMTFHLDNHRSWMGIVAEYKDRLVFKGIMITGWQRYFHTDPLCELLPVSIPSLAVNLAYLRSLSINGSVLPVPTSAPRSVVETLRCNESFAVTLGAPINCDFPGAGVLRAAQKLFSVRQTVKQFLNVVPKKLGRSALPCPVLNNATRQISVWLPLISEVEQDMTTAMEGIYDNFTKEEWIEDSLGPTDKREESLLKIYGDPLQVYLDIARIASSGCKFSTACPVFLCGLTTVANSLSKTEIP